MNWKDPEEVNAYSKAYRQAHKGERQAYRDAHKQEINENNRVYYWTHRGRRLAQNRAIWQKIRCAALVHYSTDPPTCLHCGEEDIRVLCIDHIDNTGAEHRKTSAMSSGIYYWLKKNTYPKGYQVLCHNCNARKEFERRAEESIKQ